MADRRGAVQAAKAAMAAADADGCTGMWIERLAPVDVVTAAARVDERSSPGPLSGTTVAVKGNIDVGGLRTTAGCSSFGEVAERSAPVVSRLEAAGAVIVGTTNLDQFATGLVGTRSPLGACPNVHWPALVPGGSSSGSAAVVAAGLVDLALGTDTAGSGRVPAAATGIVGVKPTRGWLPTTGVVPACASLDCVSLFVSPTASGLVTARAALAAMAGIDAGDPWCRPRPIGSPRSAPPALRLGVPSLVLADFDGDPAGAERFTSAVDEISRPWHGVKRRSIDLEPFRAAGRLLYEGAFVAERYAAVGGFVESGPDGLDPVVAEVISAAGRLPAWKLAADRTTLAAHARRVAEIWEDVDVVVVPTVPRVPTVAEVAVDPVGVNAMLGTYTNGVNLLDLCALTIPVGEPSPARPPASVTLWAPAWHDAVLLDLAAAYLAR